MLAERKHEILSIVDFLADMHERARDFMKRRMVRFSGCMEVTVHSKRLPDFGKGKPVVSLKLEADFTEHCTVSVKFVREDCRRTVYSSHLLKMDSHTDRQSPVKSLRKE